MKSSSLILLIGTRCFTLTMAELSPACTQWCKKTLLRYTLASLSSPNEIFERPKVVPTSGPVTHFHSPSVPSSLAPIQPVPEICSADIMLSSSDKIVAK